MDPMPPWLDSGAPAEADHILAVLAGEHAPENVPAVERAEAWTIRSVGEAEWAMALLAAATAQQQAVLDQVKLWQSQLDAFKRHELAQPARTVAFFTERLERWGLLQRELHPEQATIALASGAISTRRDSAPTIEITDAETFISWALNALLPAASQDDVEVPLEQTYAELGVVKTTHEAMISAIRKVFKPSTCADCDGSGLVVEADQDEGGGCHEIVCSGCGGLGQVIVARVRGFTVDAVVQRVPGLGLKPPETTATPKPAPSLRQIVGAR